MGSCFQMHISLEAITVYQRAYIPMYVRLWLNWMRVHVLVNSVCLLANIVILVCKWRRKCLQNSHPFLRQYSVRSIIIIISRRERDKQINSFSLHSQEDFTDFDFTTSINVIINNMYYFQNPIFSPILLYQHQSLWRVIQTNKANISITPQTNIHSLQSSHWGLSQLFFYIILDHPINPVIRLPLRFHSCLCWNYSPLSFFLRLLLKSNSTYRREKKQTYFSFELLSLFSWLHHIDNSR